MSELAVPEPAAIPVTATPAEQRLPVAASALVEWAQQADVAYQMAHKLAATSFVPQSLRGKPGDVAAAILAGQELGLKPMATLKSIDVIQGTPALRAHAMRGILQAKGHEIELVESDARHCVMRGRRKGAEAWQEVTWTIERAAQLGLVNKAEWKKQPGTMLVARATGEICRLVASDALHGMPYAAEELDGRPNITVQQVTPAKPLSVAALTAPAVTADQMAAPATPEPAGDADADATDDTDWQPDDDADSDCALWPPVTQPPQ